MKRHLARSITMVLIILLLVAACAGTNEPSPVPVNAQGFPTDWPVATPPGSVNGCANGTVSQEDELFSVVMCLPEEPDPLVTAQNYLDELKSEGFVEREPGAFDAARETFLEGNGIEIYFQLVGSEATVVLIKPAN